ncbi:yippee-domain-containing protein [Lentinula edodes]|uniref:Yippee-domain-containing protein n=1 Tax=Lentinula edodes TaxID=5353 RepID=A0A1Q3ETT4_LENED|nr:yippee-domain-containing protein [Lentinula edodes]
MASSISSDTRAQVVQIYDNLPTYACAKCSAVVALQDELISKAFSGRDGRGYLMHSACNVKLGVKEERPLLSSFGCRCILASEHSQKYKEGKYLLEKEKIIKDNAWTLDE